MKGNRSVVGGLEVGESDLFEGTVRTKAITEEVI